MSAPFLAHGVTLSLVWFLAVNLVASAGVACAAGVLVRRETRRAPAFWLALRLTPAVVSTLFVLAVFVPSYLKYEPREFVEGFDLTLALVAAAGMTMIAAAVVRGAAASSSVSRHARAWSAHARRLSLPDASMPAFEIDSNQPVIALVGVMKPRLLVTRGFLDALTPSELAASVAHEMGHRRALDNLKRLAMRAAPDALGYSSLAGAIERRWVAAAEHAADRAAGGQDAATRCALASALVKVARLRPPAFPTGQPISTLMAGGDVASRVQLLLEDRRDIGGGAAGVRWTLLGSAITLAVLYGPLLRAVHNATEVIVHSLP